MFKLINLYFITFSFIISSISSSAFAVQIIKDNVPFVFQAELQAIDSGNTVILKLPYNYTNITLIENAKVDRNNFASIGESKIVLRVAIAGVRDFLFDESEEELVKSSIEKDVYDVSCYRTEVYKRHGTIPVCFISRAKDGINIIEIMQEVIPKYLPFDYSLIERQEEMVDKLKKIEKKLIISDFM